MNEAIKQSIEQTSKTVQTLASLVVADGVVLFTLVGVTQSCSGRVAL